MNALRSVIASGSLIVSVVASSVALAETPEERLTRLSIKFVQDDDGNIIAVELPERSVDATIEAIADIPTITSVKAADCRASVDGIRALARLPNLKELDLERSWIADRHVAWLAKVPGIEKLSMTQSSFSNAGLERLCRSHPHLRELDISSTRVTVDTAIRYIIELRDLESLTMKFIDRDEPNFFAILPVQFGSLASLRKLNRLRVDGFPIKCNELYAFGCCRHLEELSIHVGYLEGDVEPLLYLHYCNPSLGLLPLIARKAPVAAREALGIPSPLRLAAPSPSEDWCVIGPEEVSDGKR
jgi:hypothetical protein